MSNTALRRGQPWCYEGRRFTWVGYSTHGWSPFSDPSSVWSVRYGHYVNRKRQEVARWRHPDVQDSHFYFQFVRGGRFNDFYPTQFDPEGPYKDFGSVEEAYQFLRAEFLGEAVAVELLRGEKDPQVCHRIGESELHTIHNDVRWIQSGEALRTLERLLTDKFSQPENAAALVSTGSRHLALASDNPYFGQRHPCATLSGVPGRRITDQPWSEDGCNWHGIVLMQVRDELGAKIGRALINAYACYRNRLLGIGPAPSTPTEESPSPGAAVSTPDRPLAPPGLGGPVTSTPLGRSTPRPRRRLRTPGSSGGSPPSLRRRFNEDFTPSGRVRMNNHRWAQSSTVHHLGNPEGTLFVVERGPRGLDGPPPAEPESPNDTLESALRARSVPPPITFGTPSTAGSAYVAIVPPARAEYEYSEEIWAQRIANLDALAKRTQNRNRDDSRDESMDEPGASFIHSDVSRPLSASPMPSSPEEEAAHDSSASSEAEVSTRIGRALRVLDANRIDALPRLAGDLCAPPLPQAAPRGPPPPYEDTVQTENQPVSPPPYAAASPQSHDQ